MQVEENFEVKNLTSFKCGGKIKKAVFPESVREFTAFLKDNPDVKVFGNFSNTLVSSEGYDGTVVITSKMTEFVIKDTIVMADCGVRGPKLAQITSDKGLSGLEFMIGFPGSVGGEVFMNAGANGQSVSDTLVSAVCFDRKKGLAVNIPKIQMNFNYRTSRLQSDDLILLTAVFNLKRIDLQTILDRVKENLEFRKAHQPSLVLPNCGSVFRNPDGISAGRLLQEAGAKYFIEGGARVWENHANFIINEGGTSEDILKLIEKMQNAVKGKFDIILTPELRFLGSNSKEVELCGNLKIK